MAGVSERIGVICSSSILTGLHCLDQVFWFVAITMVLPHSQVEFLQVHCVLLCIEERAADSLSPNTRSDHLQAKEDKEESDITLCLFNEQNHQVLLTIPCRIQV